MKETLSGVLLTASVAALMVTSLVFFGPPPLEQTKVLTQSEITKHDVLPKPEITEPDVAKPEVKKPEVTESKIPETVVFEVKKGNVTFNHKAHTEYADCMDCHHKTEEGKTPQRCKECHEKTFKAFHSKGSTHSCVGCHTEADAGPKYSPCSNCHKK